MIASDPYLYLTAAHGCPCHFHDYLKRYKYLILEELQRNKSVALFGTAIRSGQDSGVVYLGWNSSPFRSEQKTPEVPQSLARATCRDRSRRSRQSLPRS